MTGFIMWEPSEQYIINMVQKVGEEIVGNDVSKVKNHPTFLPIVQPIPCE